MNCYIVVLAFMFIIRFLLSQCNTLVNSAALTGRLASQLSLLFTLTRPTTKLFIVNNSSMKTITGDTRTLDFFKSTSWSRIWFEFLGTLRLLCWDLMFGQANNQLHIADRVGTVCVDSTAGYEASLGYALKFCRCNSVATEILLDGNTAIAVYQFSSVTEAGNLYSSLNDSFQTLVTIPYV